MADLLDKDFKIMVLKMLKELKGSAEKVKKIIYEKVKISIKQKPKKKQKRNSGAKKSNN